MPHLLKATLLALALLTFGCERSAVNATDAISLKGAVQDSGGAARGGATVKLFRGAPRTDGSTCPLLKGDPWKTATTAADGSYQFDFTGKDSQTSDVLGLGQGGSLARCFRLTADGADDALASMHFTVQVTDLEAPALRAYRASLMLGAAIGVANFHWVAPEGPQGASAPSGYKLTVSSAAGDAMWTQSASGSTLASSMRDDLFEGLATSAQLTATSEVRTGGTIWALDSRSEALAIAPRGTTPLSRGADCDLASPCPLTDGVFRASSVGKEAVTLTFATALPVGRVVLRGLSLSGDRLVVESSADGVTFTAFADVEYRSGDHDLAAPAATTARALRLRAVTTKPSSDTLPKLSSLSEVSVFP